ncbi:hypothetical protein U1872_18120 [Sphingomonas sp. RB3P16]|uniref:hypothetical protein n=1 Tax=Parasphingomonas frigoris TaxID=3096163 RepID=UPI002FCAE3F4
MVQWYIDTIGKLGPGIIALLVLFTTRGQNRWQNTISMRAAMVEDQKFRLALLERRNVAIEKVRFAVQNFWIEGALRREVAVATGDALEIAELVFDDAERAAIEAFLQQIWKWQSLDRRITSMQNSRREDDKERYLKTVDEISDLEDSILRTVEPLIKGLREATRVSSIPALSKNPIRLGWPLRRKKED